MLRALERFRRRGQTARARRVAHRLLEAPGVRGHDELYASVLALLHELDDEHVSLPAPSADPLVREALERMQLVA